MKLFLEQAEQVITDPDKLAYLNTLPEEILGLIVATFVSQEDFQKLKENPMAYNLRGIHRMRAVDYGSKRSQEWQRKVEEFKSQPGYLDHEEFVDNSRLLKLAKPELRNSTTCYGHYGIEVLGAAPNKDNSRTHLLIAHNQIYTSSGHIVQMSSEQFDIPKEVCVGELKWDAGYYFMMKSLDPYSQYLEVTLR